MINKKTVLILGAGASYEFGYPLGAELKARIIKSTETPKHLMTKYIAIQLDPGSSITTWNEILNYLRNECNFDLDLIKRFHNDFNESPKYSIDAFLENRPEFLELGKTMIAYSILKCENHAAIFSDKNNWYKYFFNIAIDNWNTLDNSDISIITYNYDRSFEYFFINSLMKTFGKPYEEVRGKFDKMKIIHVHGKLLDDAWGIGNKAYNGTLELRHCELARKNLHIIFEEPNLKRTYQEVNEVLSQAEQIFILGFGFDERNLSRLQLKSLDKNIKIYATRTGITDLELLRVKNLTNNRIGFSSKQSYDIIDFFKNDVSLYGDESYNYYRFQHNFKEP